jgi:hypothetical protein
MAQREIFHKNFLVKKTLFISCLLLASQAAYSQGYDPALASSTYTSPLAWSNLQSLGADTYKVPNPPSPGQYVYVQLTKGQTYSGQVIIDHSNVVFDCNHALIKGDSNAASPLGTGISIQAPPNQKIKNITIKNCRVSGFKDYGATVYNSFNNGVGIKPWFTQTTIDQINQTTISNTGCAANASPSRQYVRDCVRAVSPENILIDNSYFFGNGHGVNIKQYVSGVVVKNSTINNNLIGMHISYSSAKTYVLDSIFQGNGYRTDGTYREAIALDSTQENYIAGNSFGNNYGTGIRMYKNCGENQGNTREDHTSYNTILNNDFYLTNSFTANDTDTDWNQYFKAISVADRQSRAASQWDCSDGYYYVNGAVQVARDYSQYNSIKTNTFRNFRMPIRIQDNANTVENNVFLNSNGISVTPKISIGSIFRSDTSINDPVIGNVVTGNQTEGTTVITEPKWKGTQISLNGTNIVVP